MVKSQELRSINVAQERYLQFNLRVISKFTVVLSATIIVDGVLHNELRNELSRHGIWLLAVPIQEWTEPID